MEKFYTRTEINNVEIGFLRFSALVIIYPFELSETFKFSNSSDKRHVTSFTCLKEKRGGNRNTPEVEIINFCWGLRLINKFVSLIVFFNIHKNYAGC